MKFRHSERERQSVKRKSFTPFFITLIQTRLLSCQYCTWHTAICLLSLLSCRADIVGSSENFCQDNQTWQYPHPICKSKCILHWPHVCDQACVFPYSQCVLMHLSRLAGDVTVDDVKEWMDWVVFLWRDVHLFDVCMCSCVCTDMSKKKEWIKETQTLQGFIVQELELSFAVLFCPRVAKLGTAWPAP